MCDFFVDFLGCNLFFVQNEHTQIDFFPQLKKKLCNYKILDCEKNYSLLLGVVFPNSAIRAHVLESPARSVSSYFRFSEDAWIRLRVPHAPGPSTVHLSSLSVTDEGPCHHFFLWT